MGSTLSLIQRHTNNQAQHRKPQHSSNATVYHYGGSIKETRRSLLPVLCAFRQIKLDNIGIETRTDNPRILSIACGYGEDAPIYRIAFGEKTFVMGIDIAPKFEAMQAAEKNKPTRYMLHDARNLNVAPDFDLITVRHPEPSSSEAEWIEIFKEAARLSKMSQAPILMTTFNQKERQFFIDLSKMLTPQNSTVRLTQAYTNQFTEKNIDINGDLWGQDRYIAIFEP